MTTFMDSLKITNNSVKSPYFGIVYSLPGAGKTWLCRFAPGPFYVAVEKGVEQLNNVGKFEAPNGHVLRPKTHDQLFDMLKYFLINKDHGYKTIVVDSAKFVDKLFIADIIKNNPYESKGDNEIEVQAIGDYNFGKGYSKLISYWERFIEHVDSLNNKGMNVILIAHAREKNATTTSGDEFKKIGLDLSEFGQYNVSSLLYARSDWMYFMRSEAMTIEKSNKIGKGKKFIASSGVPEIVVYTRSKSGFDAKVRTADIDNIKDFYVIDIKDDLTSKVIFDDLDK